MEGRRLREFKAVVEHDLQTGLFVGYVPGFPGAHSQASTLEELSDNLREVVKMLLEDGEPHHRTRSPIRLPRTSLIHGNGRSDSRSYEK